MKEEGHSWDQAVDAQVEGWRRGEVCVRSERVGVGVRDGELSRRGGGETVRWKPTDAKPVRGGN